MQLYTLSLKSIKRYLLVLLAIFLFATSCKRIEINRVEQISDRTVQFFKTEKPINAATEALINELKIENNEKGFINNLNDKQGKPVWDKIQFLSSKSNSKAKGAITPVTEIALIPMTINNNTLSSILITQKLSNGTIYLNDYTVNEYLYNKVYETKSDTTIVKQLLTLYFYIENKTFGTLKFYNIPKKFFSKSNLLDSNGNKTILLKNDNSVAETANVASITTCITVTCPQCHGDDPECPLGGSWRECTTVNFSGGSSPLPGISPGGYMPGWTFGGGSGGSGSGGGSTPPPCPGTVWYNTRAITGPCNPSNQEPHVFGTLEKLNWIKAIISLDQYQYDWLNNNPDYTTTIYDELIKEISPETQATAKIIIDQGRSNLINAPWGENFGATAGPYLQALNPCCLLWIPTFNLKFSTDAMVNYVINRQEHPEWSKLKCYWEATQESIHLSLDAAGMVPVFGEVFDLTNSLIYTVQGDGLNAGLSLISVVPFAGSWVTATKWAKKTITAIDGTRRTLKWVKQTNNIISFGDRNLLRKVLGMGSTIFDSRIAHHLIPWEWGGHKLIQKAASGNIPFNLNELLNGLPISVLQHSPPHLLYNTKIETELNRLYNLYGGGAMSTTTAETAVRELALKIRNWIVTNPTKSINEIIF